MDKEYIKNFIKDIDYELDTVWHLIDFGRINDAAPILERILNKIELFKSYAIESPYQLEKLFLDSFWEKHFQDNLKMMDYKKHIKLSSTKNTYDNSEKIRFTKFFLTVRSWIYDNFAILKNTIKSPTQKKIELSIIIIITCMILGVGITYYILATTFALKVDFYQGPNFEKSIWSSKSPNIDFSSCDDMNSHSPTVDFTAKWTGKLIIPADGEYTFIEDVDDGGRLYIDGKILLDTWQVHPVTEILQAINLNKGAHSIKFEYVNFEGGCTARLFWKRPGRDKEIITQDFLRITNT